MISTQLESSKNSDPSVKETPFKTESSENDSRYYEYLRKKYAVPAFDALKEALLIIHQDYITLHAIYVTKLGITEASLHPAIFEIDYRYRYVLYRMGTMVQRSHHRKEYFLLVLIL